MLSAQILKRVNILGLHKILQRLTLAMLNKLRCHTHFYFQPIRLLLLTDSADLDQQKPTDLDLHCLQRQQDQVFSKIPESKLSRRKKKTIHLNTFLIKVYAQIGLSNQ